MKIQLIISMCVCQVFKDSTLWYQLYALVDFIRTGYHALPISSCCHLAVQDRDNVMTILSPTCGTSRYKTNVHSMWIPTFAVTMCYWVASVRPYSNSAVAYYVGAL